MVTFTPVLKSLATEVVIFGNEQFQRSLSVAKNIHTANLRHFLDGGFCIYTHQA